MSRATHERRAPASLACVLQFPAPRLFSLIFASSPSSPSLSLSLTSPHPSPRPGSPCCVQLPVWCPAGSVAHLACVLIYVYLALMYVDLASLRNFPCGVLQLALPKP
jgi:hypothetical protein